MKKNDTEFARFKRIMARMEAEKRKEAGKIKENKRDKKNKKE